MGVNGDIGLRLPDVEWAVRSNAGTLEGVSWVDYRLDPDLPVNRVVGHEAEARFRGYAYLGLLPTYIAEDTMAAQARGRPTAWEALTMVFAQAGWTVASRSHLWAPYSPYPGVLAKMVEAFGVERAVHRFDRERLSRLAAMLPSWYPTRGRLDAAYEVLAACGITEEADEVFSKDDAPVEALKDEVLCCHSATWWRARQAEGAKPAYRIEAGFLRFQPSEGEGFPLRREDVLVAIPESGKISLALHRLLPAWSAIRITTHEGPEPGAERVAPAVAAAPAPAPPAPAAPAVKSKPSLAAPTVVPADELEDEGTQDALVPEEEDEVEEIELGDADEVLEFEEIDLLEVEPEPDEDPPTDPGKTKTEKPASRREKAHKSNKSTDEK